MNVSIVNKLYIGIGVMLLSFFAYSCKENDHYDPDTSVVPNENIMELMKENPDLSEFVRLIESINYDFVLSKDESFTVWAPANASLEGLIFDNDQQILHFVTNHIARYTQSAVGYVDKNVFMQNTKLIPFKSEGDGYTFGGLQITSPNHIASNGVFHVLAGRLDYLPNIWERMDAAGLDSIKNFLYPLTVREFNLNASVIIGFNEEGLPMYDSIFIENNPFWDHYVEFREDKNTNRFRGGLFPINNEDSLYTMILPTNEAWEEAYQRVAPYFVNNFENADSVQRYYTHFALVQDLVFRGRVNPADAIVLFSTRLGEFPDPLYLFDGTAKETVSNGDVYVVNQLRYNAVESWNKPIKIEAEQFSTRNSPPLYLDNGAMEFNGDGRTVPNELIGVSNNSYYYVTQPRTTTTAVEFYLPNVLATTYKITCMFVPDIYLNAGNNARKTKIKVSMMQFDRETEKWQLIGSDGTAGGAVVPGENGEVSGTEFTNMVMYENFKFPYAFVNEENVSIKMRIETTITSGRETGEFANRMGIDYILLEPVVD